MNHTLNTLLSGCRRKYTSSHWRSLISPLISDRSSFRISPNSDFYQLNGVLRQTVGRSQFFACHSNLGMWPMWHYCNLQDQQFFCRFRKSVTWYSGIFGYADSDLLNFVNRFGRFCIAQGILRSRCHVVMQQLWSQISGVYRITE